MSNQQPFPFPQQPFPGQQFPGQPPTQVLPPSHPLPPNVQTVQQPFPGQPQQAPQFPGQQPGWPQQGQTMQQPFPGQQAPQQGWSTPAAGMPGPAAVGPQPPPPPPPPTSLPPIHNPDEALIRAAYQKAQEEMERVARQRAGAGGFRFWNPLGPRGETKWDATVPPGYSARSLIWICPPWAANQLPYQEVSTHYWKSHRAPQGTTVACLGRERCPICAARNLLFRSGNPADAERAKSVGRPRNSSYFNILLLEWPQSHWDPQVGKMLPWVFRASSQVHKDIMDIFQMKGMQHVYDPNNGRPIWVTKTKKGPNEMDVEWKAAIEDARPLGQEFWGCLYNLHDLSKLAKPATQQEVIQAITEMQLPVTAEVQQMVMAVPVAQSIQPEQPMQPPFPGQQGGPPQGPQGWPQQGVQTQPQPFPGQPQPGPAGWPQQPMQQPFPGQQPPQGWPQQGVQTQQLPQNPNNIPTQQLQQQMMGR